MNCPKCHREKHGELQSVCKHCRHCEGNDRWFSEEDEPVSFKLGS